MKRVTDYLFVRHRDNWVQLFRFGLVGGSGVLVNMVVYVLVTKFGPDAHGVFIDLPGRFNVRWYHLFSTLAFLIANAWNFGLNRRWTFRSSAHARWWREYPPFLAVGFLGQLLTLAIMTLLLNPTSPLALPISFFDSSTGLRTPEYWAQLIAIAVVTPVSFIANKLWTFAAVRGLAPTSAADVDKPASSGSDRVEVP